MAEEREVRPAEPMTSEAEVSAPGGSGMEALLRGDPRRGMLARLQRSAGNQAVLGLLRAVAPPAVGDQRAPVAGTLLVGPKTPPGPGQTTLDDFLDIVEQRVKAIAERELDAGLYRVAGCPWIDHWVGYYRGREIDEVEAAVRRYSATAATASTVEAYLEAIAERVTDGIRAWQGTGELPEPVGDGAAAGPAPAAPAAPQVARTGRALEAGTRDRMGSAFGADFSAVRVHTGTAGQALATRERARAVTAGRDIAFAAGQYAPGTPTGDALLAHELAHVLQQTGGPAVARLEDPVLEADADAAAFAALADLYLPGAARDAAPAHRTPPAFQSCGDAVEIPAQAPLRPYEQIVGELRTLKGRKEAVVAGREPDSAMTEIDQRIEEVAGELRQQGLRLETAEILDRLAADPTAYLMRVQGQVIRMPPGAAHHGDKLEFQAVLDYVPPGRLVKYGWRWRSKTRENMFYTGARNSADRVDLGTGFWSGETEVTEKKGMEVKAYVYFGDEDTPVTTLSTGWIEMEPPKQDRFALKTSQKVAIVGAPVIIETADWAPKTNTWIDWDDNGQRVATGWVLTRKFNAEGTHKIVAHLHRTGDTLLRSRGPHIADAEIEIVVEDPGKAGERMLDQMAGEQAPPSTKQLEASIESSIKEVERHVSEGGEQQEYWEERLKDQRKRLAKLRENVPDIASAEALPANENDLQEGHTYSGPFKSVLILPSGGGPQPLSTYLRAWKTGNTWNARIIDMTSADVFVRNGSAPSQLGAYDAVFRAWMDKHPYPRGAKVRYEFSPGGWGLPNTFNCKDTAWDTVKAWVDGILTVGGVIVGGLLLLTPEPTGATKALGYFFITAAAARSAIAIYENLELGIDPLDTRNVLEGISILTSALGVSGSLLRHYGIKAVSPLVYRVGNWTVMASLAGDVGTMTFISQQAIAQLRAVQADPTKDDAQKNGEFLRVAAQLFASGALFFATNKDLFKQGLKPSDFFKTNPKLASGGKDPKLTTGSRLDVGFELKKAGDIHTAERISAGKITDAELLDRHQSLPWLKSGAPADVAVVAKRLKPATMMAVGDASVRDVRLTLDNLADDALFEALAARWRSGARVRDVAAGMKKIEGALVGHPDRLAAMKRGAALEASGGMVGYEEWVKQTASRLPASGAPTAEHMKGTRELTGELDAVHALAQQAAGDPNKVITFTPAPPMGHPGAPTPRSFDITITDKRAPAGTGPERLVEVHTETGAVTSSIDLHTGVAHAASKLPLDRPLPVKGGPKSATVTPGATLPTASKEAAVVVTQWPPPAPSARGKTVAADGSWTLPTPVGDRKGHMADDLVRELNGAGLDRVGAQYLDRVTIVDGKNGRKIFSLVNEPDPSSADGSRHKWKRE